MINPEDQINGMKAFGKGYGPHGPAMGSGMPSIGKSLKSVSIPFKQDSAGKLNNSGASTRSESLARLRGKGALA